MKPITQADLARRYGYFLDHLVRIGLLLRDIAPAAQVTPENVADYLAELQSRVGSVTLYGSIYKLRRTAEILAPTRDLGWLRELEKDLDFMKVPRSKYPKLTTASRLLDIGLAMFDEAEQRMRAREDRPPLSRRAQLRREAGACEQALLDISVRARDGLMVALLTACPIRIKNFAALTLGTSIQNVAGTWWLILGATETKTARVDERPVPAFLTPMIDRYVEVYRPILDRGRLEPIAGPLWVSSKDGDAMTQDAVDRALRRSTKEGLGFEIGPHMFRTAGGTECATRAPELPGLASALLQHRHPATTEAHYNRATSHQASQRLADLLKEVNAR
jgi:integrase